VNGLDRVVSYDRTRRGDKGINVCVPRTLIAPRLSLLLIVSFSSDVFVRRREDRTTIRGDNNAARDDGILLFFFFFLFSFFFYVYIYIYIYIYVHTYFIPLTLVFFF